MSAGKSLLERPKNVGFRVGFIAVTLIVITAIFPIFVNIGYPSDLLNSFQGMFLMGLVGTMFFSFMLRQMSQTTDGGKALILNAKNISKQTAVLIVGIVAGLIMVVTNGLIYTNIEGNVLLGSVWGEIDPTAFYMGLLAGVSEELFFRGFIGTFLRLIAPALIFAVVPSALIFALFHYFAYQSVGAFIVLFVLGLILGFVHELSNDIGASMVAHVINNMFTMMPAVMAVLIGNLFIIILFLVIILVIMVIRGIGGR